jgi:hypothetical protein
MEELRRYEYGDPAKIVESREARKCNGCIHKAMILGGWFCEKGEWSGVANEKRCRKYQEASAHGNE